MHVFELDKMYVRRMRNVAIAQVVLAAVALGSVILVLIFDSYRALGDNHAARAIQSFSVVFGFLFALLGIREYLRGNRGHIGVVITPRTLALKCAGQPIRFIRKQDCVAFNPVRYVFSLYDGTEFSLAEAKLPFRKIEALAAFIFDHWWPDLSRESVTADLDRELPLPRSRIRLLFGVIFLCFGVMFALLILMRQGLPMGVVFGVVGGMLVLLLSVSRVPADIKTREQERNAYLYPLTDSWGADTDELDDFQPLDSQESPQ